MLPIYICDDNKSELKIFKKMVLEIIKAEGLKGMGVVCATPDPVEILDKLGRNISPALYFLDIDLGPGVIDGIEVAAQIRELNQNAQIVMITGYDFALETYRRKIGIRDYILKGDIKDMAERVKTCLIDARGPVADPGDEDRIFMTIYSNYLKFTVDVNEIYYIEVVTGTQRKLNIHKKNGTMSASTTLKDLISQASNTFFQCHKSFIININYVKEINTKQREVIMINGVRIPASLINIKKLEKAIQANAKK
jgi:two-component system response regulator AgrA